MKFNPSRVSTFWIACRLPAVILTFGAVGFVKLTAVAVLAGVTGASVWLAELQRRSIDILPPRGFIGS